MSTSINSGGLVLSTLNRLRFATFSIAKSKGNEDDVTIVASSTSSLYSDDPSKALHSASSRENQAVDSCQGQTSSFLDSPPATNQSPCSSLAWYPFNPATINVQPLRNNPRRSTNAINFFLHSFMFTEGHSTTSDLDSHAFPLTHA